jgi:polyferredoxin
MQAGLLTTFKNSYQRRGSWAWMLAVILFVFYIILYFTPLLDPVAEQLNLGSKWNIYGSLYTLAIILGGVYFLRRHGNSRYHRIRTLSVIFFQVVFAYSIPFIMELFSMRGFTFSIFWPLKIDYFYPSYILEYPLPIILYAFLASLILVPVLSFTIGKRWYCSWVCGCGGLAETAGEPFRHLSSKASRAWRFEQISIHAVMLFAVLGTTLVVANWSTGVTIRGEVVPGESVTEIEIGDSPHAMILYGSPKLAHPYDGKSIWMPLEETSGAMPQQWRTVWCDSRDIDPEGHHSFTIDFSAGHEIQVATMGPGVDGRVFGTWRSNESAGTLEVIFPRYPVFCRVATKVQGMYAFVVVALLSGILGVGLYPILGSRVWCRFFCPLAAIMGLIQKFGRFRITVKDDMCISCGNCSTYCEMGIDVRSYAQDNRSFKRAACVGCGMCAHVCPRGVLKLENKWDLGPSASSTRLKTIDL